ncbi:hypothetical protein KGQ20_23905 [Catenulispora sp. NF23]|uniref:Uncharacterized protein n=1 Tax=Catenulispora pinistramenti TaxID=2705254 RepID=A0ABS5L1W4_9ACTN|nr:hypothetical protein [Catenulispora pinistramenti]MBS2535812.1 hypothetical protein [Catenulispora pinistramenti]MBS2552326.1 hypothetical protein [Catenulispora pinistramenti]
MTAADPADSAEPLTPDDLALLRTHEPILAYTKGEYFLPTDIERYIAAASLWREGDKQTELVPVGSLDLASLLAAADEYPDRPLFLRYVLKPAGGREVRGWRKSHPTGIRRTGRLAAVGFVARLIDVLLRLSLLIRGTVPGGVMTKAAEQYHAGGGSATSPYYGRVLRQGGYVILQYWYFYAANDWRSTFGGVNDHEADWEMVTVYLAEEAAAIAGEPSTVSPRWVAFSSHDYTGDDLRRRWDDPDLTVEGGTHPVVFAGAGSHSGAFLAGDYLVTVNPRFLGAMARWWKRAAEVMLRRARSDEHGFGIPFIDYARGDGARVGPGQDRVWHPVLIDDDTPWVRGFRGLWGVDTRDWAGGERAPAGPRYERDGTVRFSWADPLGWAGLHKVSPDDTGLGRSLESRIADLDTRITEADEQTVVLQQGARDRHAEVLSLRTEFQTAKAAAERFGEARVAEESVSRLIKERAALAEERAVHLNVLERGGLPPQDPQAHVTRAHKPYAPEDRKHHGILLQIWAAVSVPLLFLAVATVLLLPDDRQKIPTLLGILVVFAALEAVARRRLLTTAVSVAVILVGAGVVISALEWAARHARDGFLVTMGVAALLLLLVNVRDFFRR